MVRSHLLRSWKLHAFVECRRQGGRWWLYAYPELEEDERFDTLLCSEVAEVSDLALLCDRGVPLDVSPAVRDAYSWRVAGQRGADAGNIISVSEAEFWLERGSSVRWKSGEPFERVTDPRWERATWMDAREFESLLEIYEWRAGEPAPATHCALAAMAQELEQEYLVRIVVWLEHRHSMPGVEMSVPELAPGHDDHERLEQARARVRRASAPSPERDR